MVNYCVYCVYSLYWGLRERTWEYFRPAYICRLAFPYLLDRGVSSGVLEGRDLDEELVIQMLISLCSWAIFYWSYVTCSCSRSKRACYFAISFFMSVNIWRSWASYVDGGGMFLAAPYEGAETVSSTNGLRLRPLGKMIPQQWWWIYLLRWSRCRWSAASLGPWLVREVFWGWVW